MQIGEQGAGDRTHPWDADPAWLLVRGGAQLAVAVLVESGFPLVHPAFLAPVLQGVEAPVAGGEVLRAEVQRAGLAALAGHAAAAAVALVEQLYGLAGGSQCVGGGKPGDASTDDGDGDAHDMPLWLCSVWTGESGFLYKFDLMYSVARASRRTLRRADGARAARFLACRTFRRSVRKYQPSYLKNRRLAPFTKAPMRCKPCSLAESKTTPGFLAGADGSSIHRITPEWGRMHGHRADRCPGSRLKGHAGKTRRQPCTFS